MDVTFADRLLLMQPARRQLRQQRGYNCQALCWTGLRTFESVRSKASLASTWHNSDGMAFAQVWQPRKVCYMWRATAQSPLSATVFNKFQHHNGERSKISRNI
jgi:hypothetical protein